MTSTMNSLRKACLPWLLFCLGSCWPNGWLARLQAAVDRNTGAFENLQHGLRLRGITAVGHRHLRSGCSRCLRRRFYGRQGDFRRLFGCFLCRFFDRQRRRCRIGYGRRLFQCLSCRRSNRCCGNTGGNCELGRDRGQCLHDGWRLDGGSTGDNRRCKGRFRNRFLDGRGLTLGRRSRWSWHPPP